jgi:hypothetical protein
MQPDFQETGNVGFRLAAGPTASSFVADDPLAAPDINPLPNGTPRIPNPQSQAGPPSNGTALLARN